MFDTFKIQAANQRLMFVIYLLLYPRGVHSPICISSVCVWNKSERNKQQQQKAKQELDMKNQKEEKRKKAANNCARPFQESKV